MLSQCSSVTRVPISLLNITEMSMFTHSRVCCLQSTSKSPDGSCGSHLTPDVYIMFMQGSSLFLFFLFLRRSFEKICSAYFGYQKGIERGFVSRVQTFSGRQDGTWNACGRRREYLQVSGRLRSQANPLGLAKSHTAVGSERHNGPEETLHDSSLPNQTTQALILQKNQAEGVERESSCQRRQD